MEGVITCAVAIFSVFFMVKFPDEERKKISWNFLKPQELEIVIHRLNADRGDVEPEEFTWKRFLQPATVSLFREFHALLQKLMFELRIGTFTVSPFSSCCLRLSPTLSLSLYQSSSG